MASSEPENPDDAENGTSQSAPPEGQQTDEASGASASSDSFRSFLVGLATDPAKLGGFIKDPDSSMGAANLDPSDQAVLKSGQPWMIHARLVGQQVSTPAPAPTAVVVVDMTKQAGASGAEATEQPTVRAVSQGSLAMFPNMPPTHPIWLVAPTPTPQQHPVQWPIHPQIHPMLIFQQWPIHPPPPPPVIHPPPVHPPVHPMLIFQQWPIHPPPPPPVIHWPVFQQWPIHPPPPPPVIHWPVFQQWPIHPPMLLAMASPASQ